jgi:hypothetical protein
VNFPIVLIALFISACSTPPAREIATSKGRMMFDSSKTAGDFDINEVRDMIEFCVDLDSQDDLNTENANTAGTSIFAPHPSASWNKVVDSRDLYKPGEKNPTRNGFPPFNNAWTLWKNINSAAEKNNSTDKRNVYVVAIRGTVVSSKPSIKEDALLTTIAARNGIEYPVGNFPILTFSDMPRAEVHAGFAYGVFSTMFDYNYGVLRYLNENVEPNSLIIITGHSQGAAMATLAHAFLHFSMRDKQFGLGDKNFVLKSYAFAQPKPGNSQFSMNFAEIASNKNNAFVLNNTLDPVIQVPLTVQFLADADADLFTVSWWSKLVRSANNGFNWLRNKIASSTENHIASMKKIREENLYRIDDLKKISNSSQPIVYSQNYVAAGNVIPLRGDEEGKYYPTQTQDEFIQHHATTYRRLLERSYPISSANNK